MKARSSIALVVVLVLTACATTLTDKASKVQVHTQLSNLLSSCQRIGPVAGSATAVWAPPTVHAKIVARERVADLGGDTLAITNVDETMSLTEYQTTVQGVAMRCY